MNVTIELADLCEIHQSAELYDFMKGKSEEAEKKIADLQIECERQAKEINGLRCELSTRPTTREVSPLLRQRIENAKDVLRQIVPVVADCDGSFGEVEGDRFNAVYKTLQELYDVTRAEVL